MRRERFCEGYEDRGATLVPVVLLPGIEGSWYPFNGRVLASLEAADELVAAIKTNNSPSTIREYRLDQAIAAMVYAYPNGQVCSAVITLAERKHVS